MSVEFDGIEMDAMAWLSGHRDDRTETLGFDELVKAVERFLAGPEETRQGASRSRAGP